MWNCPHSYGRENNLQATNFFGATCKKERKGGGKKPSARPGLLQLCSTCFSWIKRGEEQKKKKKIIVMGSPSGEICLDNISVSTSEGPVWVILKWEKRRQEGGERKKKVLGTDNKSLCVRMGGETPFRWVLVKRWLCTKATQVNRYTPYLHLHTEESTRGQMPTLSKKI